MNKSILFATIAVLLVAGCTNQNGTLQWPLQQITTTTAGGNGLVITDFSPDSSSVLSNSTDRISFTIDNVGGAAVPDANSLIYLTGSDINLGDTSGIYWHSSTDTSQFKHFGKTMNPESSDAQTVDEKIITWSLAAPSVSKSQPERIDDFIGRVYYDYQTTVAGTIWAYTQAESDTARASSKALNKATFSSTAGPVSLVAKTSPDPIVSDTTFTLTVKVSNVGGGSLYKSGSVVYTPGSENIALTPDEVNIVTINVNAPGMTVGDGCNGDVTLPKGSNTVSCDITMSSSPTTFQGYPITITATYGYFTERTATVTVTSR